MMNIRDKENDYHTPAHYKQFILKRMHLPLRLTFYIKIFRVIFLGWLAVKRKAYDDQYWIKQSLMIKEAIESNGGRLHITGLNNLRGIKGAVVFIGNHMSTLETFLLPHLIEPMVHHTYVVKRKLLTTPFFGAIMGSRHPIAVDRRNPKDDLKTVLEEGSAKLAQGTALVIFPQSTRSERFMPEQFNSLGVKLAKKASVPIVPIALKTDFWGNGKWSRDFGPVGKSKDIYVHFGQPLQVAKTGKEEHQQIVNFITAHLKQWGSG